MNQHDGFPGPVILVIDLDRRRILLTHRNAAHCTPPVGRMPVWSIWPFSPVNSRGTRDSRAFKSGLSDRGSSGQVGPQHPFLLLETASDLNVDILRGKVLFAPVEDRKSTRLNSSHRTISYAVFCLKKKITL